VHILVGILIVRIHMVWSPASALEDGQFLRN